MNAEVKTAPRFERDIKRLKRKYPAVVALVNNLINRLKGGEALPADRVPGVGYDVYQVRLPNTSARSGKSGGVRVIYYVRMPPNIVLLTIYSKTAQADIRPSDIRHIVLNL